MQDKRILLIDDSRAFQNFMTSIMDELDELSIYYKDNALDAFEMLNLDDPEGYTLGLDCILMDLYMPQMDGIEALKKIRSDHRYKDVPIIMVTTSIDDATLVKSFEAGAMDYIRKPINSVEFFARLNSAFKFKAEMDKRKERESELVKMATDLEVINNSLESKVEEETKKRVLNEKIAVQQSKLAEMGEMISMVAHQWKQPLNSVALYVQSILESLKEGDVNIDEIEESVAECMQQLAYMSETITDFMDFLSPVKKEKEFNLLHSVESVVNMVRKVFEKDDIVITSRCADCTMGCSHEHLIVSGIVNEFKQVILNVLNNSKDAIVNDRASRKKNHRDYVSIKYDCDSSYIYIMIEDTGGGIDEKIIPKIFDHYYTTKKSDGGTGLGLYMCKKILEENMDGMIEVYNGAKGAVFKITLPIFDRTLSPKYLNKS